MFKMNFNYPAKIGVIGTGFISKGLCHFLGTQEDVILTRILTRRKIETIKGFRNSGLLTNSLEKFLDHSDIVIECSGDIFYSAENISAAQKRNLPVVTLNSDFHVTMGSHFVDKGIITEAEGDQPGSMAALKEEVVSMGFQPLVYGNLKGYLNHDPSKKQMIYWSRKQGISLRQVTSATDGTKIQMEQALIANGLGATIAQKGLIGYETDDLAKGAQFLAEQAEKGGAPISDYLKSDTSSNKKLPNGIFIVAKHEDFHQPMLEYYKLGVGPHYLFHKPYYLPHLEIIKTIRRIINGNVIIINNSTQPSTSVAAIAKINLKKGTVIENGIGGFDLRGEAIKIEDYPDHLPIGLVRNVCIKRNINKNEMVASSDIELE